MGTSHRFFQTKATSLMMRMIAVTAVIQIAQQMAVLLWNLSTEEEVRRHSEFASQKENYQCRLLPNPQNYMPAVFSIGRISLDCSMHRTYVGDI